MNIENPAKELMQRYLKAAARYLPIAKRDDITREIESMIYDLCEERYGEGDVDTKRMESVLVELGKPSRLASKYKEEKPLIGPELMPIFRLVLFIVCIVTTVVSLIDFSLGAAGMTAGAVWLYFLDLFGSLTGIVGTVFIVFFILERAIKNKSEIDFDDGAWKIKDLPEISDKIPGKAAVIAGLIFSVIAIIILNLFIDQIGFYNFNESGTVFTPVLADEIKRLLPLFSVRIAVGAVVLLPLIMQTAGNARRQYYYQLSQMGLVVFDIGIFILLLSRGPEAFFIFDAFKTAGIEELADMGGKLYTGLLALLLGLSVWSLIRRTKVILPKRR